MALVVGMATTYHEHAGISSVICFHVTIHVLLLNRDNKQQKTLPLCSNRSSCVHCVRVCCSSFSSRWFGILTEARLDLVGGDDDFPALRRWAKEYTSNEAVMQCLPSREHLKGHFSATAKKDKVKAVATATLQQQ